MVTRYSKAARWRAVAAGLGLLAAILGCASEKQRFQVLSFFFDGVPNPDAPKVDANSTRRTTSSGRQVFLHQPYMDNKCDACHQNTADIFAKAQVRRDVCFDCHADVFSKHKVLHGPVANSLCLQCHSPHQSTQDHLLKSPAPAVCTQCHDPAQLSAMPPEHLNPKADCLSCHSGHGGDDRAFLLPPPAATQPSPPTSPPASASPPPLPTPLPTPSPPHSSPPATTRPGVGSEVGT